MPNFIKISTSSFIFSYKKYFSSHLCVFFLYSLLKFTLRCDNFGNELTSLRSYGILNNWFCVVLYYFCLLLTFSNSNTHTMIFLLDICVRFNTHTAAQSQIYSRSTRVTVVWFRCENVRILIGIKFCFMNEIYLSRGFCENFHGNCNFNRFLVFHIEF